MKNLLHLVFFLLSITVFSQTQNPTLEWEQTYGGSYGYEIKTTIPASDSGFILGGFTVSNDGDIQSGNHGAADYWVVKINNSGNIEWEQTYGGSISEHLSSIIPTSDGGCILGGYAHSDDGDIQSGSHGREDYWVVKINSSGNIEWEQTYGGSDYDRLYSIIPTIDGGYLLGGYAYSNGGDIQSGNHNPNNDPYNTTDYWIVKINSTGIIEWEQTYGGFYDDKLYSIIPTIDGGYILVGNSFSFDGDVQSGWYTSGSNSWVVKINNSGVIEWEHTYGGGNEDVLNSIINTPNGGFLLGGYTRSNLVGHWNYGNGDSWVVKINSTGTIEWELNYGGSDGDGITTAIPISDGGFLLGGYTYSDDGDIQSGNQGKCDSWVVKINSTGIIEWEQTYGGSEGDYINSIIPTSDGGFLLGGSTWSEDGDIQSGNQGKCDSWVVKINSTGIIEWQQTYGGSNWDVIMIMSTIPTSDDVTEFYNEKIKTYPNPVKDKLFVNLEQIQSCVYKILLYNSNGKLVFSSEGTEFKSSIIEISTSEYKSGLYNLNLYTKQGIVRSKIIVSR